LQHSRDVHAGGEGRRCFKRSHDFSIRDAERRGTLPRYPLLAQHSPRVWPARAEFSKLRLDFQRTCFAYLGDLALDVPISNLVAALSFKRLCPRSHVHPRGPIHRPLDHPVNETFVSIIENLVASFPLVVAVRAWVYSQRGLRRLAMRVTLCPVAITWISKPPRSIAVRFGFIFGND